MYCMPFLRGMLQYYTIRTRFQFQYLSRWTNELTCAMRYGYAGYMDISNKCGCVSNHCDNNNRVNKQFWYHGLSGELEKGKLQFSPFVKDFVKQYNDLLYQNVVFYYLVQICLSRLVQSFMVSHIYNLVHFVYYISHSEILIIC